MREVAERFEVSIDAVTYALRKGNIQRRSHSEARAVHFARKPYSYCLKKDLSSEDRELKVAGIMLYWAEGYKVGRNTTDFTNSDPIMMALYMRFLRQICGVQESKLRCSIYGFTNQNTAELTRFWSNLLQVPESQFTKPYIREAVTTSRGNRMPHGLVHVRYCDKKLLQQILAWIEEYAELCVGGRVVNCTTL